MVPSLIQNTVAVCSQITLHIPYYITSRLVNLLKMTDAPIHAYRTFDLTVCFKLINFSFYMFFCSWNVYWLYGWHCL